MGTMQPAESRVLLVTGARKGIGRKIAEHYLDRGWTVTGCSRTSSDLSHPNYLHAECDISKEAEVRRLFEQIRQRTGRLDALINNAGIACMNHALLTPVSAMESIMRTNYIGTFLCSREAARLMRKNGGGRIANLSTVAVPLALEGEAAYAASKGAVETLTRVLAREFAQFQITVNAIGPTPVPTDLTGAVPQDKISNIVCRQAIKRMGTAADVINVIDFFLSLESSFVTGQVLYLGGV